MHFFREVLHVWLGAHAGLKGFLAQMHVKHVRSLGASRPPSVGTRPQPGRCQGSGPGVQRT